jgi:hypothetical protein
MPREEIQPVLNETIRDLLQFVWYGLCKNMLIRIRTRGEERERARDERGREERERVMREGGSYERGRKL